MVLIKLSFSVFQAMAVRIGVIEVVPPNPILPFSDDAVTEDLWQYCAGDIKLKEFCIMTGVKEIMVIIVILKLSVSSITSYLFSHSILTLEFPFIHP